MDLVKIGNFLKQLRKEKGLTQEELAEQMGVARRTVSRWETGNNMPDLDILVELSDLYETDLREILSGERKSEKMNEELKETLGQIVEYSTEEKEKRRKKLNRYFILGEIFILLVILNHQFGFLSKIFVSPIDDFVAGALTGLSLLFNFIGFYDNSHEVSLRKRKRELFSKKAS
ncbi:MAG: helix-turn-helix domain-containing protein [Erysipelotrichaceae bacterium]|nr:helix-turn-helix domain-containing protein [Erysipelotrichaceae bacterium]